MSLLEFADRHIIATVLLAYLICQSIVWIIRGEK